ncbi:cupin domain-containing protein [Parahaliea maris]|uniref:Cupin domain-containing protein n=1 Tax=Parahaliea maris TaxID=2716870 RepID=A0A5C9A2I4_9GAMM|nr:cupin domain-containing protein [Parahaliea maris]TXS93980.1 cupin domain-containing protein [Parahaliea maris]
MNKNLTGLFFAILLSMAAPWLAAEVTPEQLLKTTLERDPEVEVIVTRVTMSPQSGLSKHLHPGDEFAYILGGSVTLRQEDKDDQQVSEGELVHIAPQQVHSATAGAEGVRLLVFRVHPSGQPVRVLVE